MKGIAFKLLAEVVIALVAMVVLLMVFNTLLPGYTGKALCKFYQAVLALPIPNSIKPTISECESNPVEERLTVDQYQKEKVAESIASYIKSCWNEQANQGKYRETLRCYELFFKRVNYEVDEEYVTSILKSKDFCKVLPNNLLDKTDQEYSCGDKNKIYWSTPSIVGTDVTVFIKFDPFHERIEVA